MPPETSQAGDKVTGLSKHATRNIPGWRQSNRTVTPCHRTTDTSLIRQKLNARSWRYKLSFVQVGIECLVKCARFTLSTQHKVYTHIRYILHTEQQTYNVLLFTYKELIDMKYPLN